jgi:hypothetical protein
MLAPWQAGKLAGLPFAMRNVTDVVVGEAGLLARKKIGLSVNLFKLSI